jgi:methanogenic corrinoid protein MtbC1
MGADDRTRAFERALLAMDRVGARETLLAAAAGAETLAVAESVVAPALERIGDDWEQGTVSLAQLYMAGRIAEQIVSEVLPQVRPRDGETPDVAIAVLRAVAVTRRRRLLPGGAVHPRRAPAPRRRAHVRGQAGAQGGASRAG